MVEVDSALTYLIAFLVALTTIKLWNLLRLNPRMHLITQTLQKAWDEVLGFLLTLLVLLVGYAIVVRRDQPTAGKPTKGGGKSTPTSCVLIPLPLYHLHSLAISATSCLDGA